MTDRQAKDLALSQARKMLVADDFNLCECSFQYYRVDVDAAVQEHKTMWQEADGWYHADETWSNKYGPFATEDACSIALSEYVSYLYARDVTR
jgi:hypothetical protein